MASRLLTDLIPEMALKMRTVIDICADHGMQLLVYCTYRSPEEQARLYRQSRTRLEIDAKARSLRDRGFDRLAQILIDVGPVPGELGKHVTMAGPGESYHNYKRAADSVPLVGGKAMWNNNYPGWQTYGMAVESQGLSWAGRWKTFREYPHSELPLKSGGGNPLSSLTADEINAMLG